MVGGNSVGVDQLMQLADDYYRDFQELKAGLPLLHAGETYYGD
jgi:cobalamin biosynthesis Co2+ chelatase CbiK